MNKLIILAAMLAITLSVSAAEKSEDESIGTRFHRETSFGQNGYVGSNPAFGKKVAQFKTYPNAVKIQLPAPLPISSSIDSALQERRSKRSFTGDPLTLEQLSTVLTAAASFTGVSAGYRYRTAPSGGALYPIEIYVLTHNTDSIEAGLYHYQVADTSLELIRAGDLSKEVHEAANDQFSVGSSPATLIITSRWNRTITKYADRGYRYAYIECGAITQNIYLTTTSLKLGTCAVGAFDDEATNELLEIDGTEESALMIMPLGVPK